ncbi:MAG: hypothetical protein COS89_09170 [Deltaproteobacteria bacterium CG07_land_8_20_14_0_80_38_7]|nr:MAG: hypothetical protein COS89_09170 [Deltaproteobacteria bacterium CG07_land_8_20_14_0_80_38_7]
MVLKHKKPKYILVIEDNGAHAEIVTELLEQHFSPVIINIVDNIELAYSFLEQTTYSLIITNSIVSEVRINKHIQEIKKRFYNIPIIVITGSGNEALAAKLIKTGVNEYLSKTIETLDLLPNLLKRYLS